MITCKVGENIINCYDGNHSKEQLKKWASKNILICPVCNNTYEYCHGEFVSPYFRHKEKDKCEDIYSEPESQEHIKGKRDLYEWIKIQDGITEVILEGWIPETKQRPDIMFKYNGKQYVIEYQCTPIASQYLERHELYKAGGIEDIWILGTDKYLNKKPSTKENRHKTIESYTYYYYDSSNKIFIYNKLIQNIGEFKVMDFNINKYSDLSYDNQVKNIDNDLISKDYDDKYFCSIESIYIDSELLSIKDNILKPFYDDAEQRKIERIKLINDTILCVKNIKDRYNCPDCIQITPKEGLFDINFKYSFGDIFTYSSNTYNIENDDETYNKYVEKLINRADLLNYFNNEFNKLKEQFGFLDLKMNSCYSSPTYYYTITNNNLNFAKRNNFKLPDNIDDCNDIISLIKLDLLLNTDRVTLYEKVKLILDDIKQELFNIDFRYTIEYEINNMKFVCRYNGYIISRLSLDDVSNVDLAVLKDFISTKAKLSFESVVKFTLDIRETADRYSKIISRKNKNSDIKYKADYNVSVKDSVEIIEFYLSCYTVGDSFLKESISICIDNSCVNNIDILLFENLQIIKNKYIENFNSYYKDKKLIEIKRGNTNAK